MSVPRARRRQPLSPQRIYETALGIVARHGVEALSMRKLAAELRVDAMSIYHHVADKQALLMGVYQAVLEELPLPATDVRWQQSLREQGKRFYRLARKYPEIFPRLISSQYATPREIETYQRIREILMKAGLGEEDANRTTTAIYTYATGVAQVAASALHGRLPYGTEKASAPKSARPYNPEKDFDFSIELMISGIEKLLEAKRSRSRKAR